MIQVDSVTKYYGSHPAIRDLSFSIEEGECVGFLGLNGAGKTTTLRLLSCLLLPTSGHVRVRGMDAEEKPHEIRKLIGFLPDTPPLYDEMSVSGFLEFAGRLRQMSPSHLEKRLPEVLTLCGLHDVADLDIATLSHGYRQRVGIAQAIVHEPALLILDEPIQGLDPVQIVEMREMIRNLRGKHTILLSTHILSEIEQTCDRILMLNKGKIAAQGTEQELSKRLGGDCMIEIEVRAEAERARGILEGLSFVQAVDIRDVAGDVVCMRLSTQSDVREELSKAVVQNQLGLLAMRQVSTGLENIFVNLSKSTQTIPPPAPSAAAATQADSESSSGAQDESAPEDSEDKANQKGDEA